jgi:hypothetical protein
MDAPIGLEVTGKRMFPAGMYVHDERYGTSSLPVNIDRIRTIDDASANHGEGSHGFGLIFQHATLSPDVGRIIEIDAKLWSNEWHLHYIDGSPVFLLGGFPSTSAGAPMGTIIPDGFPSTTCSAVPAVTLVTLPQLNAFLHKVNRILMEKLASERPMPMARSEQMGPLLHIASPITDVLKLPEEAWADKIDSANSNPKTIRDTVEAAYKAFPNLGWCNGRYIARNLKFMGIIKTSLVSHRSQCARVSSYIQFTARCFDYWPMTRPFDHVGFVLAPAKNLGTRLIGESNGNAFMMIPWSSSIARCALPKDPIFRDKGVTSVMYEDRSGAPQPFVTFAIGRIVRIENSAVNFAAYPYMETPPNAYRTAWELSGRSHSDGAEVSVERAVQLTKALTQTTTISLNADARGI